MKLEEINDFESLEDILIYPELPTYQQTQNLIQIFNNISLIPVDNVLDIGCGYGRHSRALAKQGFKITGIDISKKAIEIAKSKSQSPIYLVDDIRTFESDIFFDSAYAHNSTMAYFTDENDFNSALSKIHGLLNNGGLFIFDYFYPTNMLKQATYKRRLQQTKRVDDLTLYKYSEHEIDVRNQIHREKSTYIVSDENASKIFHATETLKYYELEQITNILKTEGFSDVLIFDRETYAPLTNSSIGICVVAKK